MSNWDIYKQSVLEDQRFINDLKSIHLSNLILYKKSLIDNIIFFKELGEDYSSEIAEYQNVKEEIRKLMN
jgi:hypothetical protein